MHVTRGSRTLIPVVAITAAVVIAGCEASQTHSPGRVSSLAISKAAAATPADTASAKHSRTPSPSRAHKSPAHMSTGYRPSLANAPNDFMPGYHGSCQVSQQSTTSRLCTFGDTSNPALTVAVVGDSVANEWLGGIVALGKSRHWKVVTDLHSRCPWSGATAINIGETVPYTACHTWGETALQDILTRIRPDVVVTSDRPVLGTPTNPTPGPASFAEIGKGMATYWRTLLDHHIAVVPIRESPEMGFNVPQCLAYNSVAACSVPASQAVTADPPTVVATLAMNGAVHLVNMNRVICPDGMCAPVAGRIVVFRDRHHLTYTFVMSIEAQLATRLFDTGAFGPGN